MEFSNEGASVYHNFEAAYIRGIDGQLNRINGPKHQEIRARWQLIQTQLCKKTDTLSHTSKTLDIASEDTTYHLLAYEAQRKGEDDIVGLILRTSPNAPENAFQNFFASVLLTQMRLNLNETHETSESSACPQRTEAIVDIFDVYFRHVGVNDQWNCGGREYFEQRVRHYTSRNAKVEFCLPAFPCKSSNPDKVMGAIPDRGEELALLRLHNFVQQIEAIYEPGAKVWIISDGHVFSDCIGVDDDGVDRYSAQLVEMNDVIGSNLGGQDRVGFKSLVDLFDLKSSIATVSNLAHNLNIPEIDHFVGTKLTEEAELCRRVLMSGCQPDKVALRRKIDSQDPAILALYRGFSRFMLEDLDLHPSTKSMSRSQRKKLSIKVSFEMIMRNQAYSNLVELLLPDHVRLSIHAHTNAGPKFGITLFDKKNSRSVRTVSHCAESNASSDDLLHIPTPWHNCVLQFADSPTIYVAKAKIVRDALKGGLYTGGWIEGCPGKGGYFELKPVEPTKREDTQNSFVSEKIESAENIRTTEKDEVTENIEITEKIETTAKTETRKWTLWTLPAKAGGWAVYLTLWARICSWTGRWMR